MAWSPIGDSFAYVVSHGSRQNQIAILTVDDGDARLVTEDLANALSPAWSREGDALYFVTNRVGGQDLWMQPLGDAAIPRGEPIRITTGIGMRSFAFSATANDSHIPRAIEVANVCRIPIFEGRRATWNDAEQITFEQSDIRSFDISSDEKRPPVQLRSSGETGLVVAVARARNSPGLG